MKEAFKPENYVNLPLEISKYLEYVKRLQFEQKPDYVYLENLFRGQENLLKSPKL